MKLLLLTVSFKIKFTWDFHCKGSECILKKKIKQIKIALSGIESKNLIYLFFWIILNKKQTTNSSMI